MNHFGFGHATFYPKMFPRALTCVSSGRMHGRLSEPSPSNGERDPDRQKNEPGDPRCEGDVQPTIGLKMAGDRRRGGRIRDRSVPPHEG
jgi:hypothetical protein